MKYFKFYLVIGLLLVGSFLFTRDLQANSITDRDSTTSKIEPGLRESVIAASEGTYLVYMTAQANLKAANNMANRADQGQFVYDTLRETAANSQANLVRYLNTQIDRGSVSRYESHFIVNAILVTSNVNVLDSIAQRPDVASIAAARTYAVPEPVPGKDESAIQAIEWGVDRIGAPGIWADFGATGQGIIIANIDTGVDKTHPAVANQYRGTTTGSDDYNFYDPANICGGGVCDNNDHGTHTMGTMVGDDGGANQIGVAPGAQWIAAKGCESSSCSDSSLLSSAEWMLAPCAFGDAPGSPSCDPALRPHVVNNSWGGGGGDPWYQTVVDAWQASGIVPVFSAGNSGPSSGTIGSPGDYCNVIGVGATNISEAIASFSSRGPGSFAACQNKPDVSAPGENVRSSISGGGYANFSGTSMASPHTAGCTALLLSIEPSLTYTDIYDLLTMTAVDLGAPGFDYDFGNGRIDCYEAALNLTPDFRLAADPVEIGICQPQNPNAAFDIQVNSIAGFSDPVTLSASPNGDFSINPVTPSGTSVLTVDTSAYPGPGVLPVTVTGNSTTGSKSIDLSVNVYTGRPDRAILNLPADGAADVATVPTFTWTDPNSPPGTRYALIIGTSPTDVNSIIHVAGGLTETSYTLEGMNLDPTTTYYWAVRTRNECGRRWSAVGSFTTRAEVCSIPHLAIPDSGSTSDSLTFTPSGSISDMDVYINASHTFVGDLIFTLTHEDTGTTVTLIDRPGTTTSGFGCSGDDINATINDEGTDGDAESTCGNAPALSGQLVGGDPANAALLSAFDGEDFGGTWTLGVSDNAGADTGALNGWCVIGATN